MKNRSMGVGGFAAYLKLNRLAAVCLWLIGTVIVTDLMADHLFPRSAVAEIFVMLAGTVCMIVALAALVRVASSKDATLLTIVILGVLAGIPHVGAVLFTAYMFVRYPL